MNMLLYKRSNLTKSNPYWRKGDCFGEKGTVLAKRGLFWRKEDGFGEKGIVLAKRGLFWRKGIDNGKIVFKM